MAKFDERYPNQPIEINQKSVEFEGTDLIKFGELKPCAICGSPTNWIDINLMGYFCSEECDREMWKRYFKDSYGSQGKMSNL